MSVFKKFLCKACVPRFNGHVVPKELDCTPECTRGWNAEGSMHKLLRGLRRAETLLQGQLAAWQGPTTKTRGLESMLSNSELGAAIRGHPGLGSLGGHGSNG